MCYYLTAKPIGQALIRAKNRGVDVQIIADKTQRTTPFSLIRNMRSKGIPVWIDSTVNIAHNKVMIIDQKIVLTGSYNFTAAAEKRNAENIVFIESPKLAEKYRHYWTKRQKKSLKFEGV